MLLQRLLARGFSRQPVRSALQNDSEITARSWCFLGTNSKSGKYAQKRKSHHASMVTPHFMSMHRTRRKICSPRPSFRGPAMLTYAPRGSSVTRIFSALFQHPAKRRPVPPCRPLECHAVWSARRKGAHRSPAGLHPGNGGLQSSIDIGTSWREVAWHLPILLRWPDHAPLGECSDSDAAKGRSQETAFWKISTMRLPVTADPSSAVITPSAPK
jgi:hypothetical protein